MIVGREQEQHLLKSCLSLGRNVLLEGPVGVGKTFLAQSVLKELGRPFFRIDGDARFSEQKLSGWFDPPQVMKKGYQEGTYFPGPLLQAMEVGGVLFINEMNRLPEGVQNVLLPSIDEGILQVPKLKTVHAKKGFSVVATQNPKEFVATTLLSEAILDRFELIELHYQTEAEEVEILASEGAKKSLAEISVRIVRLTRGHEALKRGASVRAAIGMAQIAAELGWSDGEKNPEPIRKSAHVVLPTRVELSGTQGVRISKKAVIDDILDAVLSGQKKK